MPAAIDRRSRRAKHGASTNDVSRRGRENQSTSDARRSRESSLRCAFIWIPALGSVAYAMVMFEPLDRDSANDWRARPRSGPLL